MIFVLLSLLFLEVCSSTGSATVFGKDNYVCSIIQTHVPSYPDFVDVNYVDDSTEKFNIHYSNIRFSKLSSAYALGYRIDLDAKMVQLHMCFGEAHIKGRYSACEPSAANNTVEEFEVNLYSHLIYSHEIPFEVKGGKVVFGKSDNYKFLFDKSKNMYSKPPSALADELKEYLSPKLWKAVTMRVSEEVHKKVNVIDLVDQIENELEFRHRNEIGERFKKAMETACDDFHLNLVSVFYRDVTGFKCIIQDYDVTIPSFMVREAQGIHVNETKISFAGRNVLAKSKLFLESAFVVFNIVYRDRSNPHAEPKAIIGEYKVHRDFYEFGMVAKPDSATIELSSVNVHVSDIEVSPTQGLYGDERDIIIEHLSTHLMSYFMDNSYYPVSRYCQGIVDEGRIAHLVFTT